MTTVKRSTASGVLTYSVRPFDGKLRAIEVRCTLESKSDRIVPEFQILEAHLKMRVVDAVTLMNCVRMMAAYIHEQITNGQARKYLERLRRRVTK